ncbi:LacI family DNA-binding transcriptional regulator [Rhizobium mayense]|uniref:LacI family DNA-binding transcriptional regulator n=1 Tax=Rhizobium mayense TaxID=1312184 RepID=A0ABT7K3H3_9HYPH|nr:LacI family DNA-binding transcriptional regulator [Rhizobium mayense]MDL2402545.1 LacI family DNA-binding transcriptional regulator [Rhizobium mayense]
MTRKRATLTEVAKRAGVSIATVSNVFSGRKPVNDELKKRVEKAAKELSFQIDRAASQLKSGKARVVGVLVPDLDDTFFTSLISRIEVMALKDSYDVIVASSRDDKQLEESRLQTLLGWRPSGIIAVPCSDIVPAVLAREVAHIPTVLVDRVITQSAVADTVTIDNFEAGEIAGRYLVEMGHKDIVLAASSLDIAPIRERVRGAVSIIHKMSGREPTAIELGSNAERGAEIFAHWLERHPLPSAVFALTNVTTLAALTALARQRVDIPEQVSIIGFDDYTWMSARKTALTAIRQPVDEIARLAWERLQIRIGGDVSEPHPSILNTSLKVRESTRRLADPSRGEGLKPAEEQPGETIDNAAKERPNRIH